METNVNQYGLLELNNSRIMINKEMLDRLIKLAKKTIDSQGEQMCIFYGEELLGNNVIFTDLNQQTDYTSVGNGSSNPLEHGVEMRKGSKIMAELLSKVPDNSQTQTSSSRKVVCNIHTHLSGISEGDNFRLLSIADINNHLAMAQIMDERGAEYISGILAVDRVTGNNSLSLIWQDIKHNKRVYRIENVTIYSKIDEKIQFDGDLRRGANGITYLQENFIPSVIFPSIMSSPQNRQTPTKR
mgnify:FL=1